jgi:hypothetical protein
MTIGQLLVLIIIAATWPFAISLFVTVLSAALPPPITPSPAYDILQTILYFVKNNAAALAAVSLLATAMASVWWGT